MKKFDVRKYRLGIVIFMAIIITGTFFFTYKLMNNEIEDCQNQFIDYVSITVKNSLEYDYDISNKAEELVNEKLYYLCLDIYDDFRDIPIEDINFTLLEVYRNKYELEDIAVFDRNEEGVYIKYSTVVEEIGLKTNRWGYWNRAFIDLFSNRPVDEKKGYGKGKFWVGPKTFSTVKKEKYNDLSYYKYAYYYNKDQDYLINAIIKEKDYMVNLEDLNNKIIKYGEEVDFVKDILVVDYNNLVEFIENNEEGLSDSISDPIIIYGDRTQRIIVNKNYNYKKLKNAVDTKIFNLNYEGKAYKLSFTPIGDDKFVVCVLIADYLELYSNKIIYILIIMGLILVMLFSYVVNRQQDKIDNLLFVENERLKTIKEFGNIVSSVPDYILKCKLDDEGNIMLTYNDGKSVKETSYISINSKPKKIENLYSQQFIKIAKENILIAFSEKQRNFLYKKNNQYYEFNVFPYYEDGFNKKNEEVQEVLCIGTNITKYILKNEEAKKMAMHDPLTSLPNRYKLTSDMNSFVKRFEKFSVIYMDLDGFKDVNDSYGHDVGDDVLKSVANRFRKGFKNVSFYRIGGDEFIAISSDIEDTKNIAHLIIERVNKKFLIEDKKINIGISIGIAFYPIDGTTIEELIKKSDMAMYQSKELGKNRWTIYEK